MKALAVLAAVLVAAAPAVASEKRPTLAELEGEVICPTCETTLDQSSSPVAQRMRAFIRKRIASGDTKSEIKAKLVADFGEGVLAEPPRRGFGLLAWLVPLAGLGAGAAVIGAVVWRWSREREPELGGATASGEEAPLDPELERRLDAELGRLV